MLINTTTRAVGRPKKNIGLKKQVISRSTKQRQIKVLRVISRCNIGGPSIHASILNRGLNHNGFKSNLITGTISPGEGDMKYIFEGQRDSIIKIPELQREINFYKDLMAFCKVFRVIYREKPDVVHSHMAKAGAIARCAVWLYNFVVGKDVKTVHTFHGHVLDGYFGETMSRFFLLVERLIAKFTDVIIAISATQKWELSEKLQIANPEKIRIINLGFDLESFFDAHHFKGCLRDKLGVDNKTILIGIIGRLVPIKDHFMFLRAAKYFIENNLNVSVKFLLVGDGALRKDQ